LRDAALEALDHGALKGTFAALAGRSRMTEDTELHEALQAAERLISRIQEVAADHLSRKDGLDERRAFYDVVEILETAPEINQVRTVLGQDPTRFGEETPVAHGGHTG
jgi:hypothetical protein